MGYCVNFDLSKVSLALLYTVYIKPWFPRRTYFLLGSCTFPFGDSEAVLKTWTNFLISQTMLFCCQTPAWLEQMIAHTTWRDLFYKLAEAHPDCLMLNFTVKVNNKQILSTVNCSYHCHGIVGRNVIKGTPLLARACRLHSMPLVGTAYVIYRILIPDC